MGKKLPYTPVSKIKGCFRRLQMTAREVHAVRKRDNNTCTFPGCGKKHSVAKGREVKIQVHHTVRPNWERIYAVIREELLDPSKMTCLCEEHHDAEHAASGDGWKEHAGKKQTKGEQNDGNQ